MNFIVSVCRKCRISLNFNLCPFYFDLLANALNMLNLLLAVHFSMMMLKLNAYAFKGTMRARLKRLFGSVKNGHDQNKHAPGSTAEKESLANYLFGIICMSFLGKKAD